MRYDDLQKLIQPHLQRPVEDVYAEFRTATGKEDADHFIFYLQDRGLITLEVFRELHAQAQVDLGPVSGGPGAPGQGTGETQGVMGATQIQSETSAPRPIESVAASNTPPQPEERPNYAMMGLLGEGSMGKIYLAKDLNLRRKVAYKELKRELAAVSPDIRERFINEAQITAQMDHPNVVPVYSIEVKDEQVAYAMKLVQGKTLKDLITETKALHDLGKELDDDHSMTQRLEWFLRLCDAMHYAHSKGVIHRDLKPANIMIGRYNEVYVMDWGIARMVQSIMQPEATTMIELARKDGHMPVIEPTQAGQAVGTPRYMSPEQAAGANMDLDERSDLYTLGTILFELVCLKPAITGNSLKEAMVNVMKGNLEPFDHYSPRGKVPREIKAIVQKSVELDREKRYRSVKEFADDIRRYLRGEPVSVIPDATLAKLQRWISRHRSATLMLVMALLLLSASALIWGLMREAQAQASQVRQTRMLGAVSASALALDAELSRLEGLTASLRSAAQVSLDSPPPALEEGQQGYFLESAFTGNEPPAPLGLEPAPVYGGKPISVRWPVAQVAPKVDPKAVADDLTRLCSLRRQFARLLLQAKGGMALRSDVTRDQHGAVLREQGTPVVRAYVALENGAYVSYPGVAGLPPGFDARKTAWYKKAITASGLTWCPPKKDGQGLGVMLSCSATIVDPEGKVRGVVGVDISVAHLAQTYLQSPEKVHAEEIYLVNPLGQVLFSAGFDPSTGRDAGGKGDSELPLSMVEPNEAVELAKRGATNHVLVGGKLIVSSPIATLGGASLVVVIDPSK